MTHEWWSSDEVLFTWWEDHLTGIDLLFPIPVHVSLKYKVSVASLWLSGLFKRHSDEGEYNIWWEFRYVWREEITREVFKKRKGLYGHYVIFSNNFIRFRIFYACCCSFEKNIVEIDVWLLIFSNIFAWLYSQWSMIRY